MALAVVRTIALRRLICRVYMILIGLVCRLWCPMARTWITESLICRFWETSPQAVSTVVVAGAVVTAMASCLRHL